MTTEQGRALLMLGVNGDTSRRPVAECKWRWAAGVMLFPEAVCPLCRNAMVSNRIWVVDEAGHRLKARYKLTAGTVIRENRQNNSSGVIHPHTFWDTRSGPWRVCMGDNHGRTIRQAGSVAHALFTGMYTRGAMGAFRGGIAQTTPAWAAWLAEVFDHSCTTARSRRVTVRGSKRRRSA